MSNTPGGEGRGEGLFAALKNIAATLVATARTRLELAGNELEDERIRLTRTLVLALAALFCFGLGILLAVELVLMLYWENRVAVLAIFVALFFGAGAALYVAFQRQQQRRQVFAASLAELEEDLRQLKAAVGHGQQSD